MDKVLIIKNQLGLHARPALKFVEKAKNFKCNITIEKDGRMVNAKSLLAIVSLGISKGSMIKVSANGEDEEKAINDIANFIENIEE